MLMPIYAIQAQIQGPSTGSVGSSSSYSYSSSYVLTSPCWSTASGYVESQSSSGTNYYVTIRWTSAGSAILYLYENGAGGCGLSQATTIQRAAASTDQGSSQILSLPSGAVASKSITVSPCTNPINPLVIFSVSTNACGPKTVSYTIDPEILPPAGVSYYWQTSSTGTSTSAGGTSFTVSTTGTYYLRALKGTCWSPGSTSTGVINITSTPGPPPSFEVSVNVCSDKVLTRPVEPNGLKYFWQTSPTGMESTGIFANSTFLATANQVYYLRSYNTSTQCWGGYTSKAITLDKPAAPASNSFEFCEWDQPILSTTGYLTNMNWYNSDGALVNQGLTYAPQNMNVGNYLYRVKNVSTNGCESIGFGEVALTIKVDCDNQINWAQKKSYGLDDNGNEISLGSSRYYTDAYGNVMQSQVKSMEQNQVWATDRVLNEDGKSVLTTLAAPINNVNFSYRFKFTTATINGGTHKKYSSSDFDLTSGLGSTNNPKPVSNNGPGTLGWYYSSANTIEPSTPITSYPYSRYWVEKTPAPQSVKSAGPGDSYRMGSGHETSSSRQKIVDELNHYFSLRPYFIATKSPTSTTVLSISDFSLVDINASLGVTVTKSAKLKVRAIQSTGSPGVRGLGGTITVNSGKNYSIRVKGYKSTPAKANIFVEAGNLDQVILLQGKAIPVTDEFNQNWVSSTFKVPSNVTSIRIGVSWSEPVSNDEFFLSGLELVQETPSKAVGYRHLIVDGDGRKRATFVDFQGRLLASAVLQNDNSLTGWNYIYYNDIGQIIAEISPNGVNLSSTDFPSFVTIFKYDHKGRMIESSSVDAGVSKFVYDENNLIRFSQNQEQRMASPQRFSYTNYDKYSRVIEFGEYAMSGDGCYTFQSSGDQSIDINSVLKITELKGFVGTTRKNDPSNRCSDFTLIEYDAPSTDLPVNDNLHPVQANLWGEVARTENANSITWYSYDVNGNIEWTSQFISGLGYKTADFIYDYQGNIVELAYQKGKPDAFHHHYIYNKDQQLVEVLTSRNGANKVSHAKYKYYAHGPVKRVEVAQRQGVDFTYTIDGRLKSINHGDPSKDPGGDGIPGGLNGNFMKDLFGITLHYNSNDFTSASQSSNTLSLNSTEFPEKFTGILRAVTYNSPGSLNQQSIFSFKYNDVNWLQDAQWGTVIGSGPYTASLSEKHRESVPSYDQNGNILTLSRKDKIGSEIANFKYNYESGTNKLVSITKGSNGTIDYEYNGLGQMIKKTEESIVFRFEYTAYGLIRSVKGADNVAILTFEYDDKGNNIKKSEYKNGVLEKTTFYVYVSGDLVSIYETDKTLGVIQWTEAPLKGSGRLGVYRPMTDSYLYEFTDHLGNVRGVLGQPQPKTFVASMESENGQNEEPPFSNIQSTRVVSVLANKTLNGNEVSRLNQDKPVGPAFKISVSAGDKIDISAWAYYEGTSSGSALDQSFLLNAIATAFGGVSGAPGEVGKLYSRLYSGYQGLLPSPSSGSVPMAFLTYVLYDKNDRRITFGSAPVTTNGNMSKEKIEIPQLTIEEQGYLYVCVINRENSITPVYFDDMTIKIDPSPVVAGADYYPFGLPMDGREITDEKYRYGFQGQYSERDSTTGFNEFKLRMYDARIGRWLSVDPYSQFSSPYVGMGNVPNMGVDPSGGIFNLGPIASGAIIGAAVGTAVGLIFDKQNWFYYAAGGAGLGAVGGGIYKSSTWELTGQGRVRRNPQYTRNRRQPTNFKSATPSTPGFAPPSLGVPAMAKITWELMEPYFPRTARTDEGPYEPRYITTAMNEIGVKEIKGDEDNGRIVEYHQSTSLRAQDDETAWCSSFLNWVLSQHNIVGTNSAAALSWRTWGTTLNEPAVGSIAVISNGDGTGHVGIVMGTSGNKLVLLGGNQSDQVKFSLFSRNKISRYVIPQHLNLHRLNFNLPQYNLGTGETNVSQTR